MPKIVIVATLDTKGPEVAYLRDRLIELGLETLVVDVGIIGEPVGIAPDVSHAALAERGGMTLEALQGVGSRGQAVELMREFVSGFVREQYEAGEISGGISLGGVGSVMGAAAIQELPIGVPKIVVAPTASGHHEFGPYVGLKDVFVVHSVVDILGLNPVLTTVLDNVAAAMLGMLDRGSRLSQRAPGQRSIAATMLGNTTAAVGAARDRLQQSDYETVVFHSNGVGGPAMEELIAQGQFAGVLDYTTNEIYDPMVGGIHDGGPDRLAVASRFGVPQVLVPGCIDFSVWAPSSIPDHLRDRPKYEHNPEYTLIQATHEEKAALGKLFAERIGAPQGPVHIIMPTQGLSLPATPGGVFWDPDGDELFLSALKKHLHPEISVETVDLHINDPRLGELAAERLLTLLEATD